MLPSPALNSPFEWVQQADGRLEPFDADRICSSLFLATKRVGAGDAFLARELTDGVLHFLATEREAGVPTALWIAETTSRVVRELGHPMIARAFTERPRQSSQARGHAQPAATIASLISPGQARNSLELARSLGQARLREESLRVVFSPEVVATHEAGLLSIAGLECPLEFWGELLPAGRPEQLLERLIAQRDRAGEFVLVDSPEHELTLHHVNPAAAVTDYVEQLRLGLRQTHLWAQVHLNAARPPWSDALAAGPLFETQHRVDDTALLAECRLALLEGLLHQGRTDAPRLRICWHVTASDLLPSKRSTLDRLLRFVEVGLPLCFVFDRTSSASWSGKGLGRNARAALLTVGLQLPQLLNRLDLSSGELEEALLRKLGPLVRLAVSAGVQKRSFLRRCRPELERAFLLDQARLVCVPQGLADVVRRVIGEAITTSRGVQLAGRILARLGVLVSEGRRGNSLEVVLDCPVDAVSAVESGESLATVSPLLVLQTAGALHGLANGGEVVIALSSSSCAPDLAYEALEFAFRHTEVASLCITCPSEPSRSLPPWNE